ncbi:Peptide-N [Spathaspora sp. JA1]|nr:Peptide-N [Spathaspora sp. JA1]
MSTTHPHPKKKKGTPPTPEEIEERRRLSELEVIPEGMSKSEWKRQLKMQKWEESKEQYREFQRAKKKAQRQRSRERKRNISPENEEEETNYHSIKKSRVLLGKQIPTDVNIIFDCEFDELMNQREIVSMSNQITRSYSARRHCQYDLKLQIMSFNKNLKKRFDNDVSQYKLWKGIEFNSEQNLSDLITEENKQQFVYLTADTEDVIEELLPNHTYIIGGIVDKNRHKKLCLNKAQELGLKVGKLPIDKFIEMNGRQVLATSHVYELCCAWFENGKDWGKAFNQVLPPRKVKGQAKTEENSETVENSETAEQQDEEDKQEEEEDYSNLADRLIAIYTKQKISLDQKTSRLGRFELEQSLNLPVCQSVHLHANCVDMYKNPDFINEVLDTIDLPSIYMNVDKRENEPDKDKNLRYDDFVVLELLQYFKHNFFTWVNTPKCPRCQDDKNVQNKGSTRFDPVLPNPDEISITEHYQCFQCGTNIQFPRINNPVSLLRTKQGRCGEWVNCFMLILQALIGEDKDRIRYVWNQEDHVWCEYYSFGLKKWIHLDPCEAVFNEPLLYCNNWGKKMSYVIGFNQNYIIDLSDKYITPEKQIEKSSIINKTKVKQIIDYYNSNKLVSYYNQQFSGLGNEQKALLNVYNDIIIPRNQEFAMNRKQPEIPSSVSASSVPKGRQTGSAEWTKSRGEDGSS